VNVLFQADPGQMELLQSVLMNCGTIVMGNNERITLPDTLRFMWEVRSFPWQQFPWQLQVICFVFSMWKERINMTKSSACLIVIL